jgi:hypothetical protein
MTEGNTADAFQATTEALEASLARAVASWASLVAMAKVGEPIDASEVEAARAATATALASLTAMELALSSAVQDAETIVTMQRGPTP